LPPVPDKVIDLAQTIRAAGGRALLVGGCVRDPLMGGQPKDWDLEVYGLEPATLRTMLDRFGSVNVVGEAFTVYKLGSDLDVSLPRRERKSGRGHRAFVIDGDPTMTVEEATRRRDFTVNAILQDPLTAEFIDPFHGLNDLKSGMLRAVSAETFGEDSLRVLRAMQFAARFQFQIDEPTVASERSASRTNMGRN
jgi:tRNA nucleotidyltransferase (CCA-adding enzyme)